MTWASPSRASTLMVTSVPCRLSRRSRREPPRRRPRKVTSLRNSGTHGLVNRTSLAAYASSKPRQACRKRERRGRRPGLRRAGHGIARRAAARAPDEAAKQFRQAALVLAACRREHSFEHDGRLLAQPIAREAERDDGVVVRPYRAVVIRHRIVARLAARQRADAPAAEAVAVEQRAGDAPRAVGRRDAGEQARGRRWTCARGRDAWRRRGPARRCRGRRTRTLSSKRARSASASSQEPVGEAGVAEMRRQFRGRVLGREHVGLHLAQRDRPRGAGAVGVEDGIVAVLPALIDEALLVGAMVLHEAVAVRVAELVDPGRAPP